VTGPGVWYAARCDVPRMTRSRESAMPAAVIAPCQGGAAWHPVAAQLEPEQPVTLA
jgi:hypothetical protein